MRLNYKLESRLNLDLVRWLHPVQSVELHAAKFNSKQTVCRCCSRDRLAQTLPFPALLAGCAMAAAPFFAYAVEKPKVGTFRLSTALLVTAATLRDVVALGAVVPIGCFPPAAGP
jgi:hypothetical protein